MSDGNIHGAETAVDAAGITATGGDDPNGVSTSDATAQANADGASSKRRLGLGFWIAAGWLFIVFFAAVFAPWLPFKDPEKNFIVSGERPPYAPSATHLFGTDQDARDLLARTVFGARVSLTVGLVAIGMGMLFGGFMGIIAGYFRGWWDRVISFVFIIFLSFPAPRACHLDHGTARTQPADDFDHAGTLVDRPRRSCCSCHNDFVR